MFVCALSGFLSWPAWTRALCCWWPLCGTPRSWSPARPPCPGSGSAWSPPGARRWAGTCPLIGLYRDIVTTVPGVGCSKGDTHELICFTNIYVWKGKNAYFIFCKSCQQTCYYGEFSAVMPSISFSIVLLTISAWRQIYKCDSWS